MQVIDRAQVRSMLDQGQDVSLVEVLGEQQYRDYHLPGAINIPVDDEYFDSKIVEALPDVDQKVIVYCLDEDCDASRRAAERLEKLGYKRVFDYEAGKAPWKASGGPIERGGPD